MTNLLKYAFIIIVSLSTSIGVVQAKFDQGIFDRAMRLNRPTINLAENSLPRLFRRPIF